MSSVKLEANFIVQSEGNGAIKKVKNFLIKIGALSEYDSSTMIVLEMFKNIMLLYKIAFQYFVKKGF